MNSTLQKFGYPASVISEYEHWVVMIRPKQVTPCCVVIAAKSDCTSLGELTIAQAGQLPAVARAFESAVKRIAAAGKFNYLMLTMVDPNPHFHVIPRYATPVSVNGRNYFDGAFPNPPDLGAVLELDAVEIEALKQRLIESWL